ncbi:MAG: phospholipid carrier-dependent glycosyltransferase [Pseudonocardiaceae bacterium]|nr:phospholipid carrier-dependent glycosyltransferase [Pseudonocardiaceae bacterium]
MTVGTDVRVAPDDRTRTGELAGFARWPVLAIAGAAALVLLLTSGRYGYFGDELYFLVAGNQHPSWGYVDQPPLLPMLARLMDTLLPGSLVGLRLPATLMTAAAVLIAALTARELGGGRRAQTLAAAAYALSPFLLAQGHLLATNTVDAFFWTVTTWLVVRWVRSRNDRLLLMLGAVTAVALQAKFLIVAFWVAVAISALLVGPRELLRRPMLWAGAAITALGMVPGLIWQANNGWPMFDMPTLVAGQVAAEWGGRASFVPLMLFGSGLLLGAVLLSFGLWRLLRSPELRPYRFLGWTVLGLIGTFLVAGGRFYYVAGLFALCWAAGAVELERRGAARWWGWVPTWPVCAASSVLVFWMLPVLPLSMVASKPGLTQPFAMEEVGWPQYASSVARTYHSLPAVERRGAVILTDTYWRASALERFGREQGLPPVYSANRGYWHFGKPAAGSGAVLYVGEDPGRLRSGFADLRQVNRVELGLGVRNGQQGMPIWLLTGRDVSWDRLWPQLFHME